MTMDRVITTRKFTNATRQALTDHRWYDDRRIRDDNHYEAFIVITGLSSRYQVLFFNSRSMSRWKLISSRAYLRHSLIQVTKDRSLNTFPGSGSVDISNQPIGLKENTMILFQALFRTFNNTILSYFPIFFLLYKCTSKTLYCNTFLFIFNIKVRNLPYLF